MEEIPRLRPAREPGEPGHDPHGDPVQRPVDRAHVAPLPQEVAEPARGPHEDQLVDLVEVPLVEQEAVEDRLVSRQRHRQRRVHDVEPVGDEPRSASRRRVQCLHPRRALVRSLMMSLSGPKNTAPIGPADLGALRLSRCLRVLGRRCLGRRRLGLRHRLVGGLGLPAPAVSGSGSTPPPRRAGIANQAFIFSVMVAEEDAVPDASPKTEPSASTPSGISIVFGLSCAWSCA